MPIDYSKWDNIELSDDSDIEVHPNVDKRSFIKWKQQDIHQKRDQRNHDIKQLEIQIPMYEELNIRANKMLDDLTDEQLGDFEGVKTYLKKTFDNSKPANPTLSAEDYAEQPTYNEMIEDLFVQLKSQLRDGKQDPNNGGNLRREIINHHKKINEVLAQNKEKLTQLYKEKENHISSDDIHTGWDRSFLNKKTDENNSSSTTATTSTSATQSVQVKGTPASASAATSSILSPTESESTITQTTAPASGALTATTPTQSTSKQRIQEEEDEEEDEEEEVPQLHPNTLKLSLIPTADNSRICQFLSNHSHIIDQGQKDALLMSAFDAQFAHETQRTKQIIYHSILIQYVLDIMNYQQVTNPMQIKIITEQLFRKIFSTVSNPALDNLEREVETTYQHIKNRCEVLSQKGENADDEYDEDENAEIQLKSLDDNVELKVDLPLPEDKERYEAFTVQLPPAMQEAMKTGSLDEVNKVFKTIPFKEAEQILEVLQEYEFISLQEGLIEDENQWSEIQNNYKHENGEHEELNEQIKELDVLEKKEEQGEKFVSTADIID